MNIDIQKRSGIYIVTSQQTINATIDEVWNYFSTPDNLNNLTPKDLKFEITTPKHTTTYLGQIIAYKIELLPKLKTSWVTEITHLVPKKMFVDEQRFGPYAMWHHLIRSVHQHPWQWISKEGFHVCRIAKFGSAIYLAGNDGKIGKVVWK